MILPFGVQFDNTKAQACPQHWNLLPLKDMKGYFDLQSQFSQNFAKSKKGERLDSFLARLNAIRSFIEKDEDDSWRRSIVCGIFFMGSTIAIHIQQLKILLKRCKSSINGSLQQLGYNAQPQTHLFEQEIIKRIPLQFRNVADIKKWTVRKFSKEPEVEKKTPNFLIHIPEIWIKKPDVETEVQKIVQKNYPCPAKCRYKFYDLIYRSVSIQTDA